MTTESKCNTCGGPMVPDIRGGYYGGDLCPSESCPAGQPNVMQNELIAHIRKEEYEKGFKDGVEKLWKMVITQMMNEKSHADAEHQYHDKPHVPSKQGQAIGGCFCVCYLEHLITTTSALKEKERYANSETTSDATTSTLT